MARTVAIGADSFAQIIEDNCFYVDKTDFIKEWWNSKDKVTLITRPRRFGKTLNMSMLECFFSYKYAGRSDLFEGLSIWKDEKYREIQGTYPVISLSFAKVKQNNYPDTRKKINGIIADLYEKHRYIRNSEILSEREKTLFDNVSEDMDDVIASESLNRLCCYMEKYYGKKAIILLDEYDTPMAEAYVNGFWDEIVYYIRNLFNATFKTNESMQRSILTGITRVSKESIFSDLNNLEVVTTTSKKYSSYFGFTETEVFAAMDEMGITDKQGVKDWYDGFTFGEISDIYNPWSITKYLDEKELKAYWANTSSNSLVGKLLREGNQTVKTDFEDLMDGKGIVKPIDEQIVYNQLDTNSDAVWSLLLASGYLKTIKVEAVKMKRSRLKYLYHMELTNAEVESMFYNMIGNWFKGNNTVASYNQFIKAMLIDDIDSMNEYMNRVSLASFSSFDVGRKPSAQAEPEKFYHGFVLGLIVELEDKYEIKSNRESGFGRYDIILRPYEPDKNDSIIIEFKVFNPKKESSIEETVQSALKQIDEKNYEAELISAGYPKEKIRKYGFAFEGKTVLIG